MSVADQVKERLEAAFSPAALAVVDESHKHAGHVGARPQGETHFHVSIQSDGLRSMPRVKAHQAIYKALDELMDNPIHALAITIV